MDFILEEMIVGLGSCSDFSPLDPECLGHGYLFITWTLVISSQLLTNSGAYSGIYYILYP